MFFLVTLPDPAAKSRLDFRRPRWLSSLFITFSIFGTQTDLPAGEAALQSEQLRYLHAKGEEVPPPHPAPTSTKNRLRSEHTFLESLTGPVEFCC